MARTRWPPGSVNPGLLHRTGRSDRQRRWVPQRAWAPAGRSIRRTTSRRQPIRRPSRDPGPTLRPHHRKTAEAGPNHHLHPPCRFGDMGAFDPSAHAVFLTVAAIPWKCGHFPLADSCNFGSSSEYRTPVHLWFLASGLCAGHGLTGRAAARAGQARACPCFLPQGPQRSPGSRPARRGRRRQAVRSSLEAGGAAPYPRAARPPAWNAAAARR